MAGHASDCHYVLSSLRRTCDVLAVCSYACVEDELPVDILCHRRRSAQEATTDSWIPQALLAPAVQIIPVCILSNETWIGLQVSEQRKQHSAEGPQELVLRQTSTTLLAELPRQLQEANVGSFCSRCDPLEGRP